MTTEVKQVLDELHRLDTQWKEADGKRDEEIEKHGKAVSDTLEKLTKIEEATTKLEDQLSKLEADFDLPTRDGERLDADQVKYERAFEDWIRQPNSHEKQSALQALQKGDYAKRAVSTTTDAAGGYAVPEVISSRIGEKLLDISPVRSLVRVVPVGTSDYKEYVDVNGTSSGWVGETGSRTETDTAQLAEVAPTMGTLYAYPKATEESLDDIFFDVQGWLVRSISKEFAYQEGEAFVTGNGTNKPTGFLNGTPVATNDEETVGSPLTARAFGTLQYLPTGTAASFGPGPADSPQGFPADVFIDCEYALKPMYRTKAKWLTNKGTLGVMRKFKDIDGNYLWQRSVILGQPSTFNGYPVVEMEAMPAIAANAFPVAFGDFEEGYLAVDRVGLRMTIDPYTTPGYVKFYVRRRQGGKIYNDDAIKVIKVAAS